MAEIISKMILDEIDNRFDLILIASQRARQIQIAEKENLIVNKNKNKCTVIALKEIEEYLFPIKLGNLI